jgi:beta-lactamase class A
LALDRRHFLIGSVLTAAGACAARAADSPQGAIAQDVALLGAPDTALEAKIAALANEAGLYVGFAAVDLVKGQTAFVRGGELFPMLGVRILPIAVAFLSLVQSGAMRFAAQVRLTAADIAPGHSPLASRLRNKATTFTARQLLEHMLLNADATATDALLKLAGGPAKIQDVIKTFGIDGLRVDRFERDLLIDEFGLDAGAGYHDAKSLDAAVAAQSEVKRSDALGRFLRDKRDTASPRAVATLIVRVMSSHLIQPRLAMLLVDLMRRTKLGEDRLKGGLPSDWTLGHCIATSRTIQGQTAVFNDAGLATNKKAAKIAMALFIKEAKLSPPELAQFHRAVSRAVVEAWR